MIDFRYGLRILFLGLAALASFTLLVASLAAVSSAVRPRDTIFNVEVQTERLDVSISRIAPFQWPFEQVSVIEGTGTPLVLGGAQVFSGALKINPPVKVQIERVALGPVTIDIENTRGESAGQWYVNDEPLRRSGRVVRIVAGNLQDRAAQGSRLLLTLTGDVRVGRPIGSETGDTTSLLRGGTLTMLASPIFIGQMYQEGTDDFGAGDYFSVRSSPSRPAHDALGFVVADERPALTAVYRIEAVEGQITRPGGGQVIVAASLLNRLTHDRLLQSLVQALFALGGLATFVSSLLQGREAWRSGRDRRRP